MVDNLKSKTVSIWTDVLSHKELFINKNYKVENTILTPSCVLYKLRFWEDYFLRWNQEYYIMKMKKKEIFKDYFLE